MALGSQCPLCEPAKRTCTLTATLPQPIKSDGSLGARVAASIRLPCLWRPCRLVLITGEPSAKGDIGQLQWRIRPPREQLVR